MFGKLPAELLSLINKVKNNPDYLKRISANKDDFIVEITEIIEKFCTTAIFNIENESFDDLFDLIKSGNFGDEEIWQIMEGFNEKFLKEEMSIGSGSQLLPVNIMDSENGNSSDEDEPAENVAEKNTNIAVCTSGNDSINIEEEGSSIDINSSNDDFSGNKPFLFKDEENIIYSPDGDSESNGSNNDVIATTDDDDDEDGDMEENADVYMPDYINQMPSTSKMKSKFQIQQERLKLDIIKLEGKMLDEKPWPLKGEVNAEQRPMNSLLEEVVEIDLAKRPAPIVTEEVTIKLSDIISKRIQEKAFDDVCQKFKSTKKLEEFKKAVTLDHEKSKLPLAEIYAKEYLKQKEELTETVSQEELTPEKTEILTMINSVFSALDSLTHFYFSPSKVDNEINITTDIPAANKEDITPMATSHSSVLAPEEVAGPSKIPLTSKDEKTSTDKKRELRKKKKRQSLKSKRNVKFSKNNQKTDENKKMAIVEDNSFKSSKTFFTKLQDKSENGKSRKRTVLPLADQNIKRFKN